MSTTSDPKDLRLTRGVDDAPVPMAQTYLVLSDDERAKGFVRPVRRSYVHTVCGGETTMGKPSPRPTPATRRSTTPRSASNMTAFVDDLVAAHGCARPTVSRSADEDYGDGRYCFLLHFDNGTAREVQMPGVALDRVRFVGADSQNIWDFPRLYIDGSSWVWKYAVNVCTPEGATR